jgi:hypothetical protein
LRMNLQFRRNSGVNKMFTRTTHSPEKPENTKK